MVDRTGQAAIQIHAVSGVRSTAVATVSGQVKWHPGHYPFFNTLNPTEAALVSFLTSTSTGMGGLSDDVKGVLIHATWGGLETARGVYNDTLLNAWYNACESRGFRMALYIADTRFGSTSTVGYLPQYLATEPGAAGGWIIVGQTNSQGVIAKRYNAAVMTRFIALSDHIAGLFNTASHFEFFVTIPETEMAVNSSVDSAYSESGYLDQLARLGTSQGTNWTKTINAWGPNSGFTSDAAWVRCFRDIMYPNRIFRSPPDIRPTDYPPSETTVANYGNTGDAYYFGAKGGTRWVGKIGSISRFEDPDGAKYGKVGANDPVYKGCAWVHHTSATIIFDSHLCPTNKDYVYGSTGVGANQTMWSNSTLQPDDAYVWREFYSTDGHDMFTTPPDCLPSVDTT